MYAARFPPHTTTQCYFVIAFLLHWAESLSIHADPGLQSWLAFA